MNSKIKYDNKTPESIEYYACNLIDKTFNDVLDMNLYPEFDKSHYENNKRKGGLGNLIEEHYFGFKANSKQEADFPEAGVELKVTPFVCNSENQVRAKERLVITMISYDSPVVENFEDSHVWQKCKLILLIYYCHDNEIRDKKDFIIKYVKLFTPPPNDLKIIKDDYKKIINKIKRGKANELSEADTMYLGACTKGSTMLKSIVPQKYYAPDKKARKRAFCFKNSYMTYVLNNYIVTNKKDSEPIVKSNNDLDNITFDELIVNKIKTYIGLTDKKLSKKFDLPYTANKAQWNMLAFRMLGIKSNKATEFKKANIAVKTIRLNKKNKNVESMSLPNYSLMDFVTEKNWEDSTFYEYLSSTKFLFIVFKEMNNEYRLIGVQLWNMPNDDLVIAGKDWMKFHNTIIDGVQFKITHDKNGKQIIKNNLPKKSDINIIHMRPHTSKSYYVFKDGSAHGNGKFSDSDELPNGCRMTKQSFWLNNDYVLKQLDKSLKE